MNEVSFSEEDSSSSIVSFQLPSESLAEFVLKFLGKKEVLAYQKDICFRLKHNEIEQFHLLLQAKIEREHNFFLNHFQVRIDYNDGSQRIVSTYESFSNFNEVRDVYPESISLIWNIVFKYPNAKTIENQEIELSFMNSFLDSNLGSRKIKEFDTGFVSLLIKHTNQSWAIEVLNMFKDSIQKISQPLPAGYWVARKFLEKTSSLYIELWITVATIVVIFAALLDSTKPPKVDDVYQIMEIVSKNTMDGSDQSIAFLVLNQKNPVLIFRVASNLVKDNVLKEKLIKFGENIQQRRLATDSAILALAALTSIYYFFRFYSKKALSHYGIKSHILVTSKAEKNLQAEDTGKNRAKFYSIFAVTAAILFSVASNFLYDFIKYYFK